MARFCLGPGGIQRGFLVEAEGGEHKDGSLKAGIAFACE